MRSISLLFAVLLGIACTGGQPRADLSLLGFTEVRSALESHSIPSEWDGTLAIERSQAGRAIRFDATGGGDRNRKVRFHVKKHDGSTMTLPSMVISPPYPPSGGTFEGPTIPPEAAGGKLVVEIVDLETGQVVHTGAAPIGF